MAFTEYPGVIQTMLQQGFLVRELEEGLDSQLAYRRLAIQELFPARIGETMTRTRKGRKVPITEPLATSSNVSTSLDNGLTPDNGFTTERYSATLRTYAATSDINLMQSEAYIANDFVAVARNNAVQAAQSMERICRKRIFGSYMGGHTWVIVVPAGTILAPDGTANPATIATAASGNVNVADLRGFMEFNVSGQLVPPSVANPLAVTINGTAGYTITGAAPYTYETGQGAINVTNQPDAVPGVLTVANATGSTWTVTAGDVIVATIAPSILRVGGHTSTRLIAAGNIITLGVIQDAVAYLRDNGVPPMPDGTYHCIIDNTGMRQLLNDSVFQNLYTGSMGTDAYRDGQIVVLLGITFITTTESYVQATVTPVIAGAGTATKVRRAIIAGAECLIQCNFEGMETWLAERGITNKVVGEIAMVDGVVQIIRPPLDRLQQFCSLSWTWIGDYAVPTDVTATSQIIPTASNAMYKRAVVLEYAG